MDFPGHTLTPTSSVRTVSCRSCRFNEYLDVERHWARFWLWRWPSHRISSAFPNHTHPNSLPIFVLEISRCLKKNSWSTAFTEPRGVSGSLLKKSRPHPNPKKLAVGVFHPSVRHGNHSIILWDISRLSALVSRLSGAKVQGRVLRATQLLETPSLLGMPNQKMTVT